MRRARPARPRAHAEPGAVAVRRYLRRHRLRLPRVHRVSLAIGAGLVAAYAAVQLVLQAVEPELAGRVLRLFLLTVVAGREPALFDAYQGTPAVPVPLAATMAIVDDLATLFLAAPLAWLVVERLRRFAVFDGMLRAFEHSLQDHRAAVDRWGVLGLAGFLWLPGWGTGPSLSVAMGILAGIPAARLLAALAASCVGVNLFWAVSLAGAADEVPDGGPWDLLPLAVIAAMAALGVVAVLRRRRHRFVLEYPAYPAPPGVEPARLAAWGFEHHEGALRLDARDLEAHGGPPARRLAESHWAGEMLLVPAMTPAWAGRLAALGVTGIRDLALLPPRLLSVALGEPAEAPVGAWVTQAQQLLAAGFAATRAQAPSRR